MVTYVKHDFPQLRAFLLTSFQPSVGLIWIQHQRYRSLSDFTEASHLPCKFVGVSSKRGARLIQTLHELSSVW